MLSHLISKLREQVTENQFTYSAVVVDNDASQSAREVVNDWQDRFVIPIDYHCEPEQNIALARNKAVENAKGNFIAFIDDDEFPVNTWLLNLYKTLLHYHADGTLGPVKPHYPSSTPAWLIKSKLCERREHRTGKVLHWGQTRTGNTLLDKKLFDDRNYWFEAEFGRTGGEDTMFFKKHHDDGKLFIWCNEAPAYETVPPERWNKSFHIRKNLRIGSVVGDNLRKQEGEFSSPSRCNRQALKQGCFILTKSMIWLASMTIFLPFSILCGQHIYMRCITKLNYNFGVLVGFLGLVMIRYRD